MNKFDAILYEALEKGASDIHFRIGGFVFFRISGSLIKNEKFGRITDSDMKQLTEIILKEKQIIRLNKSRNIDASYEIKGRGRFRINFFYQRDKLSAAFRIIPSEIPSISELHLPNVLYGISELNKGLILITGVTGSGKSTTMAAIIEEINLRAAKNIITIEDPIEYMFDDKKSIIAQRQIGDDVISFGGGLRAALREDPDVIMMGEMRDRETIASVLNAAETGHLVISTLHTLDAKESINRMISVFPIEHSSNIRHQIAGTLKTIVSQRLLKQSENRGMIPAVELLISTDHIRDCIVDPEKTDDIPSVIEQGQTEYNMQTFDQSIMSLYNKKLISKEESLLNVTNSTDFELKLHGLTTGSADL